MLEIARAVNKPAWWIEMNLGRSTVFETVAYIGPPCLRFAIVFLAAVKCGFKVSEVLCYYRSLLNRKDPVAPSTVCEELVLHKYIFVRTN